MTKRLLFPLAILLLAAVPARQLSAQQLFVADINVKFSTVVPQGSATPSSGYCNDVPDNAPNVSFLTDGGNVWRDSSRIEFEQPSSNYPGGCLALCAQIVCVSTSGHFGINELSFEIFKFAAGGNPLDPASTPPIRTVSLFNIGQCESDNNVAATVGGAGNYYCTAWDGSYNLSGIFGKTNGQYGFRAKVKTNEVSQQAGNISIEQTAAFPGESQIPIQIDVMNIHTVRSSPTVVGKITGVAAQPYNILYRLSKDATTSIRIYSAIDVGGVMPLTRVLVSSLPRVGEGVPDGTLTNGDFWDGRDNLGRIAPPGVYRAEISAESQDNWSGIDNAYPYTTTISHDPLQITDVAVKPLGASSTDQAVISYLLTEAATVYVGIYSPGTAFTDLNSVTNPPALNSGTLLRLITEQKAGRQTASTIWDGRDNLGNPVCDGDYIYAIWAELPSAAASGGVIRNQRLAVGTLPVARGLVVSLISPSSTVIGSSPSVAGLDPFYFRYTPVRDTLVTMNILPEGSTTPVRHLISRETRFANFSNRELWDGKDDSGKYVAGGIYQAELITEDPYSCVSTRVSTTTARTPVEMFRIVDVKTTPLLGGASDVATIDFELSQAMYVELKIYPTDVTVNPSDWPNVVPVKQPIFTISGMRPGRFKITDSWDGRDEEGVLKPDGRYPFTLVAHTTTAVTSVQPVMYAADKVYGYFDVARGQIIFTAFDVIPSIPTMFNSSDTVLLPPYEIDYMVTRQSSVTVQVLNNFNTPQVVASIISGEVRDGGLPNKEFWDGKCNSPNPAVCVNGDFVPAGDYNVKIVARDLRTDLISAATVQQPISVNPLRIYDMAITPMTMESPAVISYQVSEPMRVVTRIYRPGTPLSSCVNLAADCKPAQLVKMFVGMRPARAQIFETWDGTDLTLSKVPDGNYVFKVYGSTSADSISMLNGTVSPGSGLADDQIVANIPVANGPSKDDAQLEKDIWFAPNPYTGTNGYFHIPIYINSEASIKIYNLAGDLIYRYSSGLLGGGVDLTHYWPRTNSSGRLVAPGVYFAVIRLEGRDGAKGAFQTVKKILVP
ncbi:MAG: hypothetical protein A2X28_04360 [Elusimicrobia bacterium GWA2_56_46]|nr:MAG: hypothetical protein A2X28_04360 [Elusimicrobia bacterium GWA2_56_46]OGR56109.1 MAG: hypothetical protein A2X39_07780 [Elusimicrobia bacterium GWC2_56_31]HBB66147.1 hypothetical protein [Elusimicrobiota bacterium]HBW22945.1 hypothetical protein [Elusimicrobiota bacterium]